MKNIELWESEEGDNALNVMLRITMDKYNEMHQFIVKYIDDMNYKIKSGKKLSIHEIDMKKNAEEIIK